MKYLAIVLTSCSFIRQDGKLLTENEGSTHVSIHMQSDSQFHKLWWRTGHTLVQHDFVAPGTLLSSCLPFSLLLT